MNILQAFIIGYLYLFIYFFAPIIVLFAIYKFFSQITVLKTIVLCSIIVLVVASFYLGKYLLGY